MSPMDLGRGAAAVNTAAGMAALGIAALALAPAASAETTEYQVTFESTWSAATHPIGFPPSPHFSGLIGGTHTDQVTFWEVGSLATTGIKNMAELGGKNALSNEVLAAIGAGTADAVLSGGGISVSPGTVQLTFTVDESFPQVTLVSMLAPSPDWFVGVSGIDLRENGAWIPTLVVELLAHDAGTDSGPDYTSPNQPTVPAEPISVLDTGAFAASSVVGTFTFVRTGAVDAPEIAAPVAAAALELAGPNPLNESTRFRYSVPRGGSADLDVYGVAGQRVRQLFRGRSADGDATWNGRDDRGARVPAGVYFVTLRGKDFEPATRRVVVAR